MTYFATIHLALRTSGGKKPRAWLFQARGFFPPLVPEAVDTAQFVFR
ncbi:hypothetical protein GobsT_72130 [Gemmata obscuriglobus]|nr:hypothetical protein GobsT_72130 [Gemmata obscuriglobus]VTS11714.1 unnamed protein product [Gemmata obscuriglobus UQM 2246]